MNGTTTDAQKHGLRPTNLVDVWRFLGSFCIVWYHSGYPPLLEPWVEPVRLYCISWALPFFYVTVAFFAYSKSQRSFGASADELKRAVNRCWRFARLVLLYMVLYELPRGLMPLLGFLLKGVGSAATVAYTPFGLHLAGGAASTTIFQILMSLRWANYSPAYFLVNAIFITCVCFLIASVVRFCKLQRRPVIGFLLLVGAALYQGNSAPIYEHLGFGWHLVSYALVPIGVLLLSTDDVDQLNSQAVHLSGWVSSAILLLPVALYGGLTLVTMNLQSTEVPHSNLRSLFGLAFVGAALLGVKPRGRVLALLSTWGQRYSLGIFLWHPFFFLLHGQVLMHRQVVSWLGIHHPSLGYYLVLNIVVFILSWGITALLQRSIPRVVTL